MRFPYSLLCSLAFTSALTAQSSSDAARWERQAQNVTIIRDDWGIPHVYGKTDADVVFGLMYAQAEDDFNRVETNFINALGRLAEAEGESAIFRDLRMKLFINPDTLQKLYRESPDWLRALMSAWADGLNFYLYKNPQVKPRVLTRFEPWMALSFSEGSIGGDIERVSIPNLRAFYGSQRSADSSRQDSGNDDAEPMNREPGGSNGIALGPQVTRSGNTMLLINPHTSFFFRAEAQMVSEEGLNAYGALTWGQFFIYQGFNDKAGWMHTSSSVDNIDEYLETIVERNGRRFYRVGTEERPLIEKRIVVPFKAADGTIKSETFTAYYTQRGPIVRQLNGKWVSVAMMNSPMIALTQSYSRTKARNIEDYKKVMALHTNSSNNTLYADASGNFAYFHSNFVPRRDPSFDWQRPVDGSNPATEWKGLHTFEESPNVVNPPNGWVYNSNNYPYSAAGPYSPKKADFPAYMDAGSENPRGIHAVMVLKDRKDFTLQGLIDAAFDSYMPSFDELLPPLFRDFDASADSPTKQKVAEAARLLKAWDRRWAIPSVATSVGVFYGDEIQQAIARAATSARMTSAEYAATRATPAQRLGALAAAMDSLTANFGSWKTPWGEINRFQRISSEIVHPFDDAKPSIPVAFASARFGSLASFGAAPRNGTKKWYGTSGNSFVAVVEFGKDSVRARAVTAGGQSGHVDSRHFNDQAGRYATGNLRPVYFYRNQLQGHIEREYKPGSSTPLGASALQAQTPNPVNLWLVELKWSGNRLTTGTPIKLTNDNGNNSQPSFSPDGRAIVFSATRDTGANARSDIFRIDLATRSETRVTHTPENENSPTVNERGEYVAVRWQPATLFKEFGPWIYNADGTPKQGVLPGPDTTGYYTVLSNGDYALTRPKSKSFTLGLFDVKTGRIVDVDSGVPALPAQRVPGRQALTYVQIDSANARHMLRQLDLTSRKTTTLGPTLVGRMAHAWVPGHETILMAKGNVLYARTTSDPVWRVVATFDDPDLRAASAYVVSQQGDKLILTSSKRPTVAALLRDSLEAGHSGAEVAALALSLRAAGRFADMDLTEGSISALGTDRTDKKRFADGVAIQQLATTLYPTSYRAFDRLGDAQRAAGDSAAAIASYRKSLELNPQSTNAERAAAQATTRKIEGR